MTTGVPSSLRRFAQRLLPDDDAARSAFVAALTAPERLPAALVWTRERPSPPPFEIEPPLSWQPGFVDRVSGAEGPGRHPLHEAGAYYCLDTSSVFAAAVLTAVEFSAAPALVVDLCASPGGKATLAWRMLAPSLLLANEVIGKRVRALVGNLERCGIGPAAVVSRDPARLAGAIPGSADVVVVDAPCSGQSLAAKGRSTANGFHPATINMNMKRQRRILAHAGQLVRPGGFLAYMTCTFSRKENEANAEWFVARFTEFAPVPVPVLAPHQSGFSSLSCYRLWPQSRLGAGAFALLLRRNGTSSGQPAGLGEVLEAVGPLWTSRTPPVTGNHPD